MPVIKVQEIAYGRLRVPDLDVMEEFLVDFGMVRAARTADRLYMRGTGTDHHLHISEKSDSAGLVGFAFHVASEEDLHRVAKAPGASAVEAIDEPGGGKRVRLREPNGYQIEIVHGIETATPIHVPRLPLNTAEEPYKRPGTLMRVKRGPSHVKRMGHAVLATPKVRETVGWFRETLGLIGSDDVYAGHKDNILGSFNRADRGEDYVDHHILFCLHSEKAGLNHFSFEVHDVDDVFIGHEYLEKKGKYQHMWGIGRHLLGSQIYDYWLDPWKQMHEHWTDSDRLNVHNPSNLVSAEEGLDSQWGQAAPERVRVQVSP
jgi:catechol 2,3-dioxygenase-like lactoylglutathione lyase family enzyme